MLPSLDAITQETAERAARVEERCGHRIVGFVTRHHALAKQAIVVDGAVRWFPNDDEFKNMMGWKKYPDGPGIPHDGWPADETPAPPPIAAPAVAPSAPARSVLTAPPSAKLLESTEAALGELARELGCVWNEEIPHNAGWFVPGNAKAHASAYDAIRGLFARLEAGGSVYRAPAAATTVEAEAPTAEQTPKRKTEQAAVVEQGALF